MDAHELGGPRTFMGGAYAWQQVAFRLPAALIAHSQLRKSSAAVLTQSAAWRGACMAAVPCAAVHLT